MQGIVTVGAVDCDVEANKGLCGRFGVRLLLPRNREQCTHQSSGASAYRILLVVDGVLDRDDARHADMSGGTQPATKSEFGSNRNLQVQGFPTLKVFPGDKPRSGQKSPTDYQGPSHPAAFAPCMHVPVLQCIQCKLPQLYLSSGCGLNSHHH